MVQSMVGCRSNVTSYAIGVHFFAQLARNDTILSTQIHHTVTLYILILRTMLTFKCIVKGWQNPLWEFAMWKSPRYRRLIQNVTDVYQESGYKRKSDQATWLTAHFFNPKYTRIIPPGTFYGIPGVQVFVWQVLNIRTFCYYNFNV